MRYELNGVSYLGSLGRSLVTVQILGIAGDGDRRTFESTGNHRSDPLMAAVAAVKSAIGYGEVWRFDKYTVSGKGSNRGGNNIACVRLLGGPGTFRKQYYGESRNPDSIIAVAEAFVAAINKANSAVEAATPQELVSAR